MSEDPPPSKVCAQAARIRADWSEDYALCRWLDCLPQHLDWALAVLYDRPLRDPRPDRTRKS